MRHRPGLWHSACGSGPISESMRPQPPSAPLVCGRASGGPLHVPRRPPPRREAAPLSGGRRVEGSLASEQWGRQRRCVRDAGGACDAPPRAHPRGQGPGTVAQPLRGGGGGGGLDDCRVADPDGPLKERPTATHKLTLYDTPPPVRPGWTGRSLRTLSLSLSLSLFSL